MNYIYYIFFFSSSFQKLIPNVVEAPGKSVFMKIFGEKTKGIHIMPALNYYKIKQYDI